MKKQSELTKKVLLSVMAAGLMTTFGMGSAWAEDNTIGTVTVGGEKVSVTSNTGTISLGADDKDLVIDGGTATYADAVALYTGTDHLTLKGKNITIQGNNDGYGLVFRNLNDKTNYSSATVGGKDTERLP